MSNFEKIAASPETLGAFLDSLNVATGPWDEDFHNTFCDSCERENCDVGHCPHEKERNNPTWWLKSGGKPGEVPGLSVNIKAAFPILWGKEYYTVEMKKKEQRAPCICCNNKGKVTIKGVEYECPKCKGDWRKKEVIGKTTVYSVAKWELKSISATLYDVALYFERKQYGDGLQIRSENFHDMVYRQFGKVIKFYDDCIIGMCTLGSFAAWKAGNVVLGGFTLLLTFCIGIRFLVKPTTERAETESKGAKLDGKGIVVSLFFGLTIGFGTGFVGSGGGMMMLVVFTAFLGMDLKSAVGTSTFIMTFTALIASVSHILIHPAILLDRWPVLAVCMAVATAASLVSARFANRVDNRTVGQVTGVVLTLLGGALILLHYWEHITAQPLAISVLRCFGEYLLFIVSTALLLLILHFTMNIPQVVFRKLLHLPAFCSAAVVVWRADSWQAASLTLALFAVIVYPVLHLLQGWNGYDRLFVQKKPGEVKRSLLLLFLTDAALVALCWGVFDLPWIAVAGILMWGSGDGAAALIGHRSGKHHVMLPLADPKKTWEGSAAMAVVSTAVGTAVMLVLTGMPWYCCLLMALTASLFGTYTELISRNGDDTITVPTVNVAVLLILQLAG